jgi:uncharacterized SAM-binding protein YcdF (DUF218 family)
MEIHKYRSAIVISSNYHMRRVKNIYEKVNKSFIAQVTTRDIIQKDGGKERESNYYNGGIYKNSWESYGIHGDRAKVILVYLLIRVFYR